MDIKLKTDSPFGRVLAKPSKSDMHRKLICASLADRETKLLANELCDDTEATAECLKALGAGIDREEACVRVKPIEAVTRGAELDCRESGSTLRFLVPVAAALGADASFSGCGRLPQRPLQGLIDELSAKGMGFSAKRLPFTVSGKLSEAVFTLPGNVSSQYISGLLMAFGTGVGGRILLSSPLQSAAYVDMTIHAMEGFGVRVEADGKGFYVKPGQSYRSMGEASVDGDWSNAAFFLCMGALSEKGVSVSGLDMQSVQGDRAVLRILSGFGAVTERNGEIVTVRRSDKMRGMTLEVSDIPDLLPVLSVVAACCEGETRFTGAGRLRLKESDRLTSTARMLCSLGGEARVEDNTLLVKGTGLRGGTVDSFFDHRIVMSAAVASAVCGEGVVIHGAQAVSKSYPDFFDDYITIGGKADVL